LAIRNGKVSCIMKKTILGTLILSLCAVSAAKAEEGQTGEASWYGPGHIGHKTATGEIFTGEELTAAHRDLPLGSLVRVVNKRTGRSVVVRINDRGPFVAGRIIDLSARAARDLGVLAAGLASVRLERVALP
jgi:rare lipoprotein A